MNWWWTDDELMMNWQWTNDELMMNWWWTDDELMMNWWWADDEQMMNRWWADDEQMMSRRWTDDELMMNRWWADDELMMNWWWADDELLSWATNLLDCLGYAKFVNNLDHLGTFKATCRMDWMDGWMDLSQTTTTPRAPLYRAVLKTSHVGHSDDNSI